MVSDLTVVTLKQGEFTLPFSTPDQLANDIEEKTGILIVDQLFITSGEQIPKSSLKGLPSDEIHVIKNNQESARYFITVKTCTIKVYLTDPIKKTVFDLYDAFSNVCKKHFLNYPIEKYVFYFNREILDLSASMSTIPPDSNIIIMKDSRYLNINYKNLVSKLANIPENEKKYSFNNTKTDCSSSLPFIPDPRGNNHTEQFSCKDRIYQPAVNIYIVDLSGRKCGIRIKSNYELIDKTDKMAGNQNYELIIDDDRVFKRYDDIKLNDYNEIIISPIFTAGGYDFFSFNSMEKAIEIEFSPKAPKWRVVKEGVSWQGKCNNRACEANGRYIISNKGYGVYDVHKQRLKSKCPLCKKIVDSVEGCGFYDCQYRYRGILTDGEIVEGEGKAKNTKYTAFLDGNNVEWQSIRIEVFSSPKVLY